MYSYEDRVRAVRLYIKLGKRVGLTIRQLGYPTENALKSWYREYEERGDLPPAMRASRCTPKRRRIVPSSTTLSTAAASWRRSRRWAIPRGICYLSGSKRFIPKAVPASLAEFLN